ncbi:DsbA family oxidoreductase [Salinirussus salinus]|uniref:DsbA family oxidoreductase n=1 Tax=Salinirussus salinus TaxID=1198300 RepID=UPI001358EB77|nr:DsbA family oxidoreductase [Salinirussus salinus]
MSETETTAEVTVYSDYVCPFCYLGRQSLEQYEETREAPLRIDWHPFGLRAGKRNEDGTIDHEADDGKDEAYYEQARENVRRLQEQYDVEMVEELRTDVDSLNAQLVSYRVRETEAYGTWLAFDEAVFDALWKEGQDIGDPEVLENIAADIGIDPGVVEGALEDDTLREELEAEFDRAKQQGVTGVPTFVCDGTAARGAVPPEHLQRLVEGTGG